jgi:hypothetical protein
MRCRTPVTARQRTRSGHDDGARRYRPVQANPLGKVRGHRVLDHGAGGIPSSEQCRRS